MGLKVEGFEREHLLRLLPLLERHWGEHLLLVHGPSLRDLRRHGRGRVKHHLAFGFFFQVQFFLSVWGFGFRVWG